MEGRKFKGDWTFNCISLIVLNVERCLRTGILVHHVRKFCSPTPCNPYQRDCRSGPFLPVRSQQSPPPPPPQWRETFQKWKILPKYLHKPLLPSSTLTTWVKSQDTLGWDKLGLRRKERNYSQKELKGLVGASMLEPWSKHPRAWNMSMHDEGGQNIRWRTGLATWGCVVKNSIYSKRGLVFAFSYH